MINLSGYTFLRNATDLGYPWVEAILSVLPICDEFVIGLANDSADDTATWAKKLQAKYPEKIRLFPFDWPAITNTGTSIGAAQTLVLRQCKGWYALVVQADELHHPDSLPTIQNIVKDAKYEAVSFPFLHLMNNCQEIIPLHTAAYTRAVRLVRNIPTISAHHDGWTMEGFRSLLDATPPQPIFHLGYEWPENVLAKWQNHAKLYPDLDEYASMAAEWQAKADANDFGPEFDQTDSPYPIPPIIKGLLGTRKYVVRPELLK